MSNQYSEQGIVYYSNVVCITSEGRTGFVWVWVEGQKKEGGVWRPFFTCFSEDVLDHPVELSDGREHKKDHNQPKVSLFQTTPPGNTAAAN